MAISVFPEEAKIRDNMRYKSPMEFYFLVNSKIQTSLLGNESVELLNK